MLATDLHNPKINNRMSHRNFNRQLVGVGIGGKDLPENFIKELFDEVQCQLFIFPVHMWPDSDVPLLVISPCLTAAAVQNVQRSAVQDLPAVVTSPAWELAPENEILFRQPADLEENFDNIEEGV